MSSIWPSSSSSTSSAGCWSRRSPLALNPLDIASWWTEPVFYQKVILWTMLLECLGMGGSWGPMAGHFKPFTCGRRTYLRADTIRQPPWRRVPLTGGDRRTSFDVLLYAGVLVTLAVALALPGRADGDLTALGFDAGRVSPLVATVLVVLMVTLGLRDKAFFLQGARRAVPTSKPHYAALNPQAQPI